MKGSLKTLRINNHSTKTNFNDWSDPKYTIPCKRETSIIDGKTSLPSEAELSDKDDVRSITSNTYVEIGELRHRIRTGSPLMTKKEVREYRLPFHESLLLNLKDDGFLLTHEFVKDLIAVDEAYHKEPGRDKTEKRKILKYTKSALVPLANGLMKAESSRLNEEKTQEATAFLDLATYFGNSESSWSWIALEMFEQCMEVMKNIEQPDPQLQAISKHLYGSFLFYKQQDFNEARAQIESSMALSEGKYWKVGETETNLYLESCGLLHKIFLEMSQRELIRENIEEAIQLCRNSLLWAKVISDKSAEADALHKLIKIYLSAQLLNSVPELLECYMRLCTELGNVQGQCEGYILSARYNSYVDNKSNVIEDMKNLLKIATENHITKMVALAHHKLASYSLLAGSDQELLEHSIEAYMTYLNLNANMKERDEAKCLVGIAQGQQMVKAYCNLVFEADNNNIKQQSSLFHWKDLRIPFSEHKLELIPEISPNVNLLERVEWKRAEENLDRVLRRQSISMMTSRRASTIMFRPIRPSNSNTTHTTIAKDRNQTVNEQTFKSSNSTIEETKYRSISFLDNSQNIQSASELIEQD